MIENEVISKVSDLFRGRNALKIEREVSYRIDMDRFVSKNQITRVDLIITDSVGQIGIECKTKSDSKDFRKLMAGIGQAWVLQKVFGRSYLAIEVDNSMLPDTNKFEFYKREALLENSYLELGIGIIFVGEDKAVIVRETKQVEPVAADLFTRMKS